jgi:ribonuclease BN (tRNA processing enzyme)
MVNANRYAKIIFPLAAGLRRSTRWCLFILAVACAPACLALSPTCPGPNNLAVQVLGSGGPIADDARASSAYLVWVDGKSRALIDAGGGAFLRFGEAGAQFQDLDFIGLSHFHADHSADLPALLKSGWFSRRAGPLTLAGPGAGGPFPGLDDYLGSLLDGTGGAYRYLSGYLDGGGGLPRLTTAEVPADNRAPVPIEIASSRGLAVHALPVPHGIVPALAFRVSSGGRVIVFASDQNGSDPAFIDFALNADLLVMHMAVPEQADPTALKLHATPGRIGSIAQAAKAGELVLSHFMARSLRSLDESLALLRKQYGGPVHVAEDLACLPVSRRRD